MSDLWNKIKNYVLGFFGILATLFFGLFMFEKNKAENETALKDNAETQGKVDEISDQIKDVQQKTAAEENKDVSKDDLLNFLNDDSNK